MRGWLLVDGEVSWLELLFDAGGALVWALCFASGAEAGSLKVGVVGCGMLEAVGYSFVEEFTGRQVLLTGGGLFGLSWFGALGASGSDLTMLVDAEVMLGWISF